LEEDKVLKYRFEIFVLLTFVFLTISKTNGQNTKLKSAIDTSRIKLIELSLLNEFNNLNNPKYYKPWYAKDIYVIDSNIVKSELPKLQFGKFILISLDKINKKAMIKDLSYIKLALLKIDSLNAKVV
jgi:hypothetical protein